MLNFSANSSLLNSTLGNATDSYWWSLGGQLNEFFMEAAVAILAVLAVVEFFCIGDRRPTRFSKAVGMMFMFVVTTSTFATVALAVLTPLVAAGLVDSSVPETIAVSHMVWGAVIFSVGMVCCMSYFPMNAVQGAIFLYLAFRSLILLYYAYHAHDLDEWMYAIFITTILVAAILLRFVYISVSHVIQLSLECAMILSSCYVFAVTGGALRVFSFNYVMPTQKWACSEASICDTTLILQVSLVAFRLFWALLDYKCCENFLSDKLHSFVTDIDDSQWSTAIDMEGERTSQFVTLAVTGFIL